MAHHAGIAVLARGPCENCITRRAIVEGRLLALVYGAILIQSFSWGATLAFSAEADLVAGDLVCFSIDDPSPAHGTIVTADSDLVISPPCRIDEPATELCLPSLQDEHDAAGGAR